MIVPTFSLATERFTRLRLHRQIEFDASGPMELSFSFGSGAIGSFELRYIALESGQNGIYGKDGAHEQYSIFSAIHSCS